MWSVPWLLVHLCLYCGLTSAGIGRLRMAGPGKKSGMGMSSSWKSSSKGMGMSSMSYKGHKGSMVMGNSMQGMKKSTKMEHNPSKYDKLNMMSYRGHSGKGMRMGFMSKGMGSHKMKGSMMMMGHRYPDDDFFHVDDGFGGKGKGRSMMIGKGKGPMGANDR